MTEHAPALRSIMVQTQEQGTLACAPVLDQAIPSVLVCGSLGAHALQWHLAGKDAIALAEALREAGKAAEEAEIRESLDAGALREGAGGRSP